MSEVFDPYRKWLGIPPQHQPPHHYRLLGIEAFEPDADVIANAADGRMAQVKTFQTGKNSEASQRILNELAAAKVCLLNPEKKAAYDLRLRETIRAEQAAQSPAPGPAGQIREALPAGSPPLPPDIYSLAQGAPPPPPPVAPLEQMEGLTAASLSPDGGPFVDYASPSFAGAAGRGPAKNRIVKKRRAQNWQIPAFATLIGLLLVAGVVMIAMNKKQEEEKQQRERDRQAQIEEEQRALVRRATKPKPSSPSPAKRRSRDFDLHASNVPKKLTRPRLALSPEATQSSNGSMIQTTKGRKDQRSPSEKGSAAKTGPGADVHRKKLPVPAEDEQRKAEAKIKDIYKQEFVAAKTTEGRLDLAAKLREQGMDMSDDPTAKFVLWRLAFHEAADAGSLAKAAEVIDKIDQLYKVDADALKAEAGTAAVKGLLRPGGATVEAVRELAATALTLAEAAADADRFDVASNLAKVANRAAAKTGDSQLKRESLDRSKEIERLRKIYAAVEESLQKAAADPSDADADLAAGRWHCFIRGNWDKGLPLLAKGKDGALSAVAKQDLADPKDAKEQTGLGDAWWTLAEKEPVPDKAPMFARAWRWYNEALPELTGLEKARVERRMKSPLASEGPSARGGVQLGNVASSSNGARMEGPALHPGSLLAVKGAADGGFAPGETLCEWTVILDKVYRLQEIRFPLRDKEDGSARYILQVSADGREFVSVADRSRDPRRGLQVIHFWPRPVKIIKLMGLQPDENQRSGLDVDELEAYCLPPGPPK